MCVHTQLYQYQKDAKACYNATWHDSKPIKGKGGGGGGKTATMVTLLTLTL